jgi:alpha-L-fucosidase
MAVTCACGSAVNAAEPTQGVTVEAAVTPTTVPTETPAQRDARMAWWRDAKFGLFIHWGVYAVPAGKYGDSSRYGEWIMHTAKIPVAEYRKFADRFNPTKYDPNAWMDIARDAGMRYVVITSKHHEGFALFPSTVTDWDVADATPYRKDLLAPLVQAAHQRDLKIGFYYSQAQDWVHPGGAKAGSKDEEGWDDAHKGKFDNYLKQIAVPQVRELLTRYPIDILWWDTPSLMTRERAEPLHNLIAMRPSLITNNRLGGGFRGDTETPEQFVPSTGYLGDWETCMTLNDHWGYNAADKNWKSSADLIRKLADICSKGGNFLLNVGPTGEGEFPPECIERLREVGAWLKVNGESIYGTRAGPFTTPLSWGCATRKGDRLYLHVFKWPVDGKLRVPLLNRSARASLLVDPSQPLGVSFDARSIMIDVPSQALDAVNTVVVLDLDSAPQTLPPATEGAKVTASAADANADAEFAIDGTAAKRWRAPKTEKDATLELTLATPMVLNGVAFDEPDVWPRLKQTYTFEALVKGEWKQLADGTTNGHGIRKWWDPIEATSVRLRLRCEAGAPGVAEVMLLRPE